MEVVLSLASALFLALVTEQEEPKKEGGGTTGNVIIRRAAASEPTELDAFLKMNPEEHFDIGALNSIDWHALMEAARKAGAKDFSGAARVHAIVNQVHQSGGKLPG